MRKYLYVTKELKVSSNLPARQYNLNCGRKYCMCFRSMRSETAVCDSSVVGVQGCFYNGIRLSLLPLKKLISLQQGR